MRRKSLLGLSVISLLVIGCAFAAEPPDFSGTWKINKDKSDYTIGFEEKPDLVMTIEQSGDSLKITQKIGGQREVKINYKTDGEPHEIPAMAGRTAVARAKWQDDKLMVNITRSFNRGGEKITNQSEEKWGLSAGGKVLTIDEKRETPQGMRTSKMVFEKQ